MVAIPTTADLMVPKDVSCEATLWGLERAAVKWDPQPVPQAALKLPVLEVEAQGGGGYQSPAWGRLVDLARAREWMEGADENSCS